MNPELVSSLITAGAGLLGAVLGAGVTLIATRRTGETAFAQVRYGIQQQRISEVLNTTYDRLGNLFSTALQLSHLPDRPGPDVDVRQEHESGITEYFRAYTEMSMYLLRNQLWMPSSIFEKARHIADALDKQVRTIRNLLNDQSLTDERLKNAVEVVNNNTVQVQESLVDLSREIANVMSNEDIRTLDIPAFSPESLPEPDSSPPDS